MKRMIDETDQQILADIWQQLDDKAAQYDSGEAMLTPIEQQMLHWLQSYGNKLVEIEERKRRWQTRHKRDL